MNILDMVLGSSNGGVVGQIAKQLGIPEPLARVAIAALLPALTKGLQRNVSQPSGLDSLLGALQTGNHSRYLDSPQTLGQQETIEDGNKILGHILGSKDVSRNVAGRVSQETGIDAEVLKKMLPMLGTLAMGSLSRQSSAGGELSSLRAPSTSGADPLSMLSGFLSAGGDDSDLNDILDLKKRYF
jgi:hypothetical protein